jgi:RHS repeat-associated protein
MRAAFNGYTETVHYAQFSTPASLASALAGMFSRDYIGQGLCAHASGATITFQLTNGGTFGGLQISGPTSSFQLSGSGWSSQVSTADSGVIALQVDGPQGWVTVAQTQYGEGSTPVTVAAGLAAHVVSGAPVTVTAVNDSIYLQSAIPGAQTDYSYTLSTTSYDSSQFSEPSFMNPEASGNLDGGANQNTNNGVTIYSYSTSYYANDNVAGYADSVMGTWNFTYDNLNRLSGATDNQPNSTWTNYCWSYDAFGNRTWQEGSNEAFQSGSGGLAACSPQSGASLTTVWAQYPTSGSVNNQATSTSDATAGVQYDAAGDITNDGNNQYLYDAEGRICAVQSLTNLDGGPAPMTGYVYDADGQRIAKGTVTAWSCDPSSNGFSAAVSETDYIVDQSGQQVTELASDPNGTMNWTHTNVWAGTSLLGTYDADGLHFYLNDWLGTRRAQTDAAGVLEQTCVSLAFGDSLNCSGSSQYPGSLQYPTEHHFTGKERDAESGNDYFGARYYNSMVGRWLSPDWAAGAEAVPYASYGSPQTLNLYAYVGNNPVSATDPAGHAAGRVLCSDGIGGTCGVGTDPDANGIYSTDGMGLGIQGADPVLGQANFSFYAGNWAVENWADGVLRGEAQQQYGRQADGSYKADPAKVQAAIDSKTPIGNGQCVAACSRLSGVTPHTASWTPGTSVLNLNDTTDVGLAIASFGPNGKFTQPGGDQNSAIYMGHDPKTGQIMVVDQWPPPNAKQYNAPFEHPLLNHGEGHNLQTNRMENNAYYYHVIVVP